MILLSGEAHRQAADWLAGRYLTAERRDLGSKGFDDPVEAWSLVDG